MNNRDAGLKRARILGPWLEANGIAPIFVIWETGFLELAGDILKIAVDRIAPAAPERVEGWVVDKLKQGRDRAFEVTSREAGVKAIWENMKSRGEDASGKDGGMELVAEHMKAAFAALAAAGKAAPSIHLLGHSAGAIMLGSFLSALGSSGLQASTTHLWAPACSVSFATATFGKAFADGTVDPKKTFVSVLSDENEQSDPCVPAAYSKSLLYLVSRALESDHKTPILGMQKAWKGRRPTKKDDIFNQSLWGDFAAWDKVSASVNIDEIAEPAVPTLREDGKVETIDASHGSFDNNIDVVNSALKRILGRKPPFEVTNLKGF